MSSPFGRVHGASLKDQLREHGPLDPARAVWIIAQVAAALDAAHAAGQLHRNVRPENIRFSADGLAHLVEFGSAHPGGYPSYLAPEWFVGGRVGPQTDVYALACVLYECLTGWPPFRGEHPQEVIDAHLFAPPPRPSIMRRGIGRAFNDVIAHGLAKDPAERFSSAGELAAAARAAASSGPTDTRPLETVQQTPDDTGYGPYLPGALLPRRARSGRIPLILTAAAVLILGVAVVLAVIAAIGQMAHRPEAAPAAPPAVPAPTTTMPSLSRPVQGADGLGFVGHSARCDPGNPPAAVVRTAQSLAVVCQAGPGSFYYRGERLRDGANIELTNAVRASGGFDVTNPANGVRYQVRPERLTIVSNGHVDSAEPVLQYASAGS
ncbi:protein kinase domain-containing protein [Mycobacterium szulgai]|uniref:non-specific serine/threonine protein kinase n=1 Tax=Mycobacterium szulgai TaxID=1787 RepID=A0A1X2EHX9_MYCSZ|nr:serine/threonine-protein kinase [Mycobacterium szulgai]ORX02669.1 hypothetical protein AWC27_28300 [Mycobacterium szulgai]